MHLFGDPNLPKRNLTVGAILLALSSSQISTTGERLIWATNTSRVDYFFLVLWAVLLFAAIKIFRVGLSSVPPDPKDQRLNQPGLD
jgi:hypothetical protein